MITLSLKNLKHYFQTEAKAHQGPGGIGKPKKHFELTFINV